MLTQTLLQRYASRPSPEINFRKAFSPVLSVPFLPLPLFPPPRSGPSNPATWFTGALLAPPAGENDTCSHQTRSLGSKYSKMRLQPSPGRKHTFWVFRVHSVSGGCKCPVFVKGNLIIKADAVVSEWTICYRVVAYYILRDYFLRFISGECFNTQNNPLVTALVCMMSARCLESEQGQLNFHRSGPLQCTSFWLCHSRGNNSVSDLLPGTSSVVSPPVQVTARRLQDGQWRMGLASAFHARGWRQSDVTEVLFILVINGTWQQSRRPATSATLYTQRCWAVKSVQRRGVVLFTPATTSTRRRSTPTTGRAWRLILWAHIALTLTAAHDTDAIRPRLSVVACERHLAMPYDVVDAAVLQRLGVRPDLDKLGVPRQLAYRQTGARAHEVDDGSDRRAETVRNVPLRLERFTLNLQISYKQAHKTPRLLGHQVGHWVT